MVSFCIDRSSVKIYTCLSFLEVYLLFWVVALSLLNFILKISLSLSTVVFLSLLSCDFLPVTVEGPSTLNP